MKKVFVFLLITIFAFPGSVFAAAPIVSTGSATFIGETSATLSGNITDLNGNDSSNERGFEYGETTSYGETASETGGFPTGVFTLDISSLSCGTTYYFRAYAKVKLGDIGYGSQQTFDTQDCVLPTLGGISSSETSQEGVSLSAFITNNPTNTITSRGFEYGVSDSYGQVESEIVSLSGSISYVSQFGSSGSGNGQFSGSKSIEIDSLGNIYVLDSGNSRVQKFDSDGTYLSQFGSAGTGDGEFTLPSDIAIDSSDNIYVVDAENFRVQKFDSDGTYLSQFGSFGTDDGEFTLPASVAIDSSGNIYVSDAGVYIDEESRIQKFDSDGTYLSQFGSTGSGDGEFYLPMSLYIDSYDNIYVVDAGSIVGEENRIQKFDSDGTYLSQFGSFGTDDGEFTLPTSLVIDSFGYIYVNDAPDLLEESGVDRIQKFDSGGDFLLSFGETGSGDGEFSVNYDIALDLTGSYLYVVDSGNNRVQKLSTGKYSMDITGLTCGTTYHYRAFATTVDGTGYSDDATFTTSDCPPEEPASVVISTGTYVGRKSLPKTPYKVYGVRDEAKKEDKDISCTPFTTLMRLGSKQGEVAKLQQTLNALGFNTGPVDGWFGNLTNAGVKAFQASQNIDADGIVGPVTRGKLNSFCN